MAETKNIAVLGAGIAGLAFATLARRAGHQISLFDQFDQPAPVGSGLMLQATGLAILETLGLATETLSLTSPITRLHGETVSSGRTVLDVRFTALRASLRAQGIQRSALFGLLFDAALKSGVDLKSRARITSVDDTAGQVHLDNDTAYGPYDLIIDALGVNSPLVATSGKLLPYGALWATIPLPKDAPFAIDALEQRYQGAHKMAGVMPSGRRSIGEPVSATYFWSIRKDAEEAWRTNSLADWKYEARALWPETECLLDHLTSHDQLTFARYKHRTTSPTFRDRFVHIGDSWHAASPQLGQGANMALLDAYALCLALERSAGNIQKALRLFLRLRANHVRLYQVMSFLFTPVYQSDSHILPWLRDGLAATLSRIPPAPGFLAAMVSGALLSPLKRLGLTPLDI